MFNISVISEDAHFELFKHFGFQSGANCNKFDGFEAAKRSDNGILYITAGINSYISAKTIQEIDLGTHTMFIADVTNADIISHIPSATYAYYHSNIKPKPNEKKITKRFGDARFVDMSMRARSCRRILSVRFVSTPLRILKNRNPQISCNIKQPNPNE